jgi:parvulin-like peptidyl-prolyl isomerase
MRKIILMLVPLIILACLFGSSSMIQPEAEIATVDGRPIIYERVDSTIDEIRVNLSYGVSPDSLKTYALDSLITEELMEIKIDSVMNDLEGEWEFRIQRRDNVAEVVKKILFNKQISGRVSIDSSRMAEHYEESKDKFMEHERVKARHILIKRTDPDTSGVASERRRKELVDRADQEAKVAAESILDMALSGRDWDSLASAYSEDKSNASKGGDLGYFFRGRMVPEFDSVAFSTEPGKIVGPVTTKFGYHIIKVEEHHPERQKPLEEVSGEIQTNLTREDEKKFASAFLDSLKQAGRYQYNEEVLASDEKHPDETWVMTVNEIDTLYYKRYIESLPRYMKWKQLETATADDKKDMLGYLASNLLLISAGRTLEYYDDPEVATAWHDFTYREAKKRVGNMLKDTEYEPTDEEIEDYYYSHISDYTYDRPLLVHHIIFEDSSFATIIRDSITAGADFVEMAKKYYPGEPEIREVAYDLDYIGPDDMGRDFFAAANALDVGKLSDPVKTKWGYHIIKLVSKKEDKSVRQVRPGIKHKLKNARNDAARTATLNQWRAESDIVINEKLYRKINPPQKKVITVTPVDGSAGD